MIYNFDRFVVRASASSSGGKRAQARTTNLFVPDIMSIYKACDIRGKYGNELSEHTAYQLGKAVGTLLPCKRVVVGGDVRTSTPFLKEQLIRGLMETGCEVVDIGIVPTPVLYFARHHLCINGGVMVTASHNPAEYNGFKITLTEWPITLAEMAQIQVTVESEQFALAGGGTSRTHNVLSDYENFIESKLTEMKGDSASIITKPLKIVIDCGNGCYSRIAPAIFRKQGYQVLELFCEEDGRFPYRNPNPAVAKHLTELCRTVVEKQADLGVAFDGDGDRVVFVDAQGQVIENDKMIALFVGYLLPTHPGAKIVYDIKCSGLIRDQIRKHGGQPLMEKSGHAYIKTRLFKEQAIFGGEISGHFFFQAIHGDDGLFAALLLSNLLRESGRSLHDMAAALPHYYITPDIRIPYQQPDAPDLLEHLAAQLEQTEGCEVSRLDGVRVEFAYGWGLIRTSVTEPLLTFRFEADSLQHLDLVKNQFLAPAPKLKFLVDAVWQEHHLPSRRCRNENAT